MSMGVYELYLDESTIRNSKGEVFCSVAGVVINKDIRVNVRRSLGDLKYRLWEGTASPKSKIIHLVDANAAYKHRNIRNQDMMIFRNGNKIRSLYNGVGDIFNQYSLPVIGTVYKKDLIESAYASQLFSKPTYEIAMQLIIENFAHFLIKNNGVGRLILESRNSSRNKKSDALVQQYFYSILASGTLYYPSKVIQDKILDIKFIAKRENDAGLQLADFVPVHFAKNVAGNKMGKPNIYQTLRKLRYDGGRGKPDRYGIKVLP